MFKFLVMTEKNIFVYKLFLSLNISDFSLMFYVKTATPPEKGQLPLSQQPPSKEFPADLATFTEEILNRKRLFCVV